VRPGNRLTSKVCAVVGEYWSGAGAEHCGLGQAPLYAASPRAKSRMPDGEEDIRHAIVEAEQMAECRAFAGVSRRAAEAIAPDLIIARSSCGVVGPGDFGGRRSGCHQEREDESIYRRKIMLFMRGAAFPGGWQYGITNPVGACSGARGGVTSRRIMD